MTKYYGKFRGTVLRNVDKENRGRLLVNVPAVMGDTGQNWALPAAPFAGVDAGIFVVPPEKANVWVEFEGGDAKVPIWSGGFWDERTVPPVAVNPRPPVAHILLQTTGRNSIHICEGKAQSLTSSGIVLKSGDSTIVIGPEGVKITASKIEISGVTDINNGALKVTK